MKKIFVTALFLIVSATCFTAESQTSKEISSKCTVENLQKHLVAPCKFSPVPVWRSSYWKDSIPEPMRKSYIEAGEKHIGTKWETTNIALFSDFRENGDRERYEQFIFSKRNRLIALAMAEIMEGKGRFMNDILNGLFSVCEETWWGVPAHYGPKMPTPDNQTLDLFNAETGGIMAWMLYMFREPITQFSPYLEARIQNEISRRILEEADKKTEWWRSASMNWNPWICSNWMACVLFAEPDRSKQIKYMRLIDESLDGFIDGYPDDGGCDEGAHYWDRAAGSLFDCLNLLSCATGGFAEFSSTEKIRLMGDYLCKMNIGNGYFVNFADAAPKLTPQVEWFTSGLYMNNKELISMTANTAEKNKYFEKPARTFTSTYLYTFNRELMLLSKLSEFKKYKGANVLLLDSWLPRIQVMTARSKKNSTDGLFVAAKGGHNNESHNHNDVGHFIVYADGQPLLIDPGVGTYRKETFNSATRYKIWSMQSGYHNLPQINGTDQQYGSQYAAKNVSAKISSQRAVMNMDIAGAYPKEAMVKSWKRIICLNRGKDLTVTEKYELEKYIRPTELMFMTQAEPNVGKDRVTFNIKGKVYGISFNPNELKASYEELKLDDKKFVYMWGKIYRVKLTVVSKESNGEIKYSIKEF